MPRPCRLRVCCLKPESVGPGLDAPGNHYMTGKEPAEGPANVTGRWVLIHPETLSSAPPAPLASPFAWEAPGSGLDGTRVDDVVSSNWRPL